MEHVKPIIRKKPTVFKKTRENIFNDVGETGVNCYNMSYLFFPSKIVPFFIKSNKNENTCVVTNYPVYGVFLSNF